jgi:hypothetical protein
MSYFITPITQYYLQVKDYKINMKLLANMQTLA